MVTLRKYALKTQKASLARVSNGMKMMAGMTLLTTLRMMSGGRKVKVRVNVAKVKARVRASIGRIRLPIEIAFLALLSVALARRASRRGKEKGSAVMLQIIYSSRQLLPTSPLSVK
jgi:hypothetical protein